MRVLNALLLMPLLGLVLPRSGLLGCTKLMMPRPRSSNISNPSLFPENPIQDVSASSSDPIEDFSPAVDA